MTPARRAKLQAAIDLIAAVNDRDAWEYQCGSTINAMIGMGAQFTFGKVNTVRLGGVTARNDFDQGEHLLLRWSANARKALAEAAPDEGGEEEE